MRNSQAANTTVAFCFDVLLFIKIAKISEGSQPRTVDVLEISRSDEPSGVQITNMSLAGAIGDD
jgi:hypothetical protein